MKTTFQRLCAMLLVCCSVFSSMIFTASAEEITEVLQTKWDFGDAAMGVETFKKMNSADSTVGYEYIAFSKTNDYGGHVLKNLAGAYPMAWGETYMKDIYGFIPTLEYRETPETLPSTLNEHWLRYRAVENKPEGAYVRVKSEANSSISPGIAFTANQTGTVRFELQYSYDSASLFDANLTKIWVGKADEMKYEGKCKFDENTAVCSPDASATNELQTWTIEMDVEAGDKVCFVVQYYFLTTGKIIDVLLHLKSAEYICGDLTANPITYVCTQESEVREDNTFDVRLSSAVYEAEGKELGYYVTVKQGDKIVIDDSEISITANYTTIEAYKDETKTDELSYLQGTTFFCGILRDLSAEGVVTIELSAFAGSYCGPTFILTYNNGIFESSKVIN